MTTATKMAMELGTLLVIGILLFLGVGYLIGSELVFTLRLIEIWILGIATIILYWETFRESKFKIENPSSIGQLITVVAATTLVFSKVFGFNILGVIGSGLAGEGYIYLTLGIFLAYELILERRGK